MVVMETISQTRVTPTNEATHFYGYDGYGNVRFLTDADGVITDRCDYGLPSPQGSGQTGAFGNLITRSGTTVNHLQYCGEYLDPDLGLYFLKRLRGQTLNIQYGGRRGRGTITIDTERGGGVTH